MTYPWNTLEFARPKSSETVCFVFGRLDIVSVFVHIRRARGVEICQSNRSSDAIHYWLVGRISR